MLKDFLYYKYIKLKKIVELQSKKAVFPHVKCSASMLWYLCTCEAKMCSYQ